MCELASAPEPSEATVYELHCDISREREPQMRMTARLPARLHYVAEFHPYSWSLIIVATVTGLLWLVQHTISAANIALFYLVVVLLCAATAGRGPAVIAAVASFLTFKFFFVEPVLTYTIDNITDPWQLFSFVAAALIAGAITLGTQK
jgi:two-component system sensor histidine kinase KdpD